LKDPKVLVEKLIELVKIERKQINVYQNHDNVRGKTGDMIL